MSDPTDEPTVTPRAVDPPAAQWVGLGMITLLVLGVAAFFMLRAPASPPPKEIADDPLLVSGRAVYLDRCVSCHGFKGRGDGPIARGLAGPPVGDLSDTKWKHGDTTEQVRAVIVNGVPGTAMPGWGRTLGPDGVRAATAYVLHLGGRPVPQALRTP